METSVFANKIRALCLEMTYNGKSSHIGSILSCADILAVLFNETLDITPEDCFKSDRDRFILSKGHAGAGVYAALALKGFFSVNELTKHYANGSIFSGHVSHKEVPGVEFSTGSLGHGLSVGVGMALAAKKLEERQNVYVLLSDGEMNEGSNWEAIMAAAHFNLNNLVAIIDYNKLQSLTSTEETMGLEPLVDKLNAFGWSVVEVDGHCVKELSKAMNGDLGDANGPLMVVANTTKGKGVSFMENQVLWHYASPSADQLKQALLELSGVTHA